MKRWPPSPSTRTLSTANGTIPSCRELPHLAMLFLDDPLELTDPGFDFTILSDFRTRLLEGGAEQVLLDAMLAAFKEQGWLKQRQRQRTDSTHVLAKVRAINRLMCTGSAMRFALNSVAVVAGGWLLALSPPEWLDRYGHRTLVVSPSTKPRGASGRG